MSATTALGQLAELAEDQWGLVTRAQAQQHQVAPATLARLAAAGGALERVGHGVYRVRGGAAVPLIELRVAWLQLAPTVPAWRRTEQEGVVSHRSAAVLLGLGDLTADRHEFTVPHRHQTRRRDVRLHRRSLGPGQWARSAGDMLPHTRAARLVSDLLLDREEPSAVAEIMVDALDRALEDPESMALTLRPFAARFGLPAGDGAGLLASLAETAGADPAPYLAELGRP
jgi:hypothetical protein